MVNDLKNSVALITGASGGLGKALCEEFARAGFGVAANYFEYEKGAQEAIRRARGLGVRAEAFRTDVGDAGQVTAMFEAIDKAFGRLDVLVHAAGQTIPNLLLRLSHQDFDAVIRTHLKGAFLCTRAAAAMMQKQRNGSIIYIGSILGMRGVAGEAPYAAAKAGLIGLAKSAARELGRWGVRANVILPGYMLTDMGRGMGSDIVRAAQEGSVLGVHTTPEDTARMVVAVAQASWISGQVLNFDSRIV